MRKTLRKGSLAIMSWSIHPDTCAQAARALNELLPLVERGERHRECMRKSKVSRDIP